MPLATLLQLELVLGFGVSFMPDGGLVHELLSGLYLVLTHEGPRLFGNFLPTGWALKKCGLVSDGIKEEWSLPEFPPPHLPFSTLLDSCVITGKKGRTKVFNLTDEEINLTEQLTRAGEFPSQSGFIGWVIRNYAISKDPIKELEIIKQDKKRLQKSTKELEEKEAEVLERMKAY